MAGEAEVAAARPDIRARASCFARAAAKQCPGTISSHLPARLSDPQRRVLRGDGGQSRRPRPASAVTPFSSCARRAILCARLGCGRQAKWTAAKPNTCWICGGQLLFLVKAGISRDSETFEPNSRMMACDCVVPSLTGESTRIVGRLMLKVFEQRDWKAGLESTRCNGSDER
jgi:hypothetical protein